MIEISPFIVECLGILGFLVLVVIGLPISFSFALSGFTGIALIAGMTANASAMHLSWFIETVDSERSKQKAKKP